MKDNTPKKSGTLILLDTNVWVWSTQLLRAGAGAPLLHHVHVQGARILLPEVVKSEIYSESIHMVEESRAAIDKHSGRVNRLMGLVDETPLPTDSQVTDAVTSRLAELSHLLIEVPSSDAVLARAGRRVIAKQRPHSTTGNDSFKDCAIWESLLEAGAGWSRCVIVSKDLRAFFDATQKHNPIIDPSLSDEASARDISVVAFNDVGDVLSLLRAGASGYESQLADAIDFGLESSKVSLIAQWNLGPLKREIIGVKAFTTATVGELFVEFEALYDADLVETEGVGVFYGRVRITGTCRVRVPEYTVTDLQPHDEQLLREDDQVVRGNVNAYVDGLSLFTSRRRAHKYAAKAAMS